MARLDEPALRLVLLGLERVRVEAEHLQVVQDISVDQVGSVCLKGAMRL